MALRPAGQLPRSVRWRLRLQQAVSFGLAPLSVPVVVALLRLRMGYRIEGLAEVRRRYRELWSQSHAPLLVCANHLTMIDSALIAWALGSPGWYLRHFSALPWNVPERTHFAATPLQRALAYAYKCLPISRGGDRADVAEVLAQLSHLLRDGQVGLVFPEGGRSRSGRVDPEAAAYGVGRIVRAVPGCRVLCVYLRGERQDDYSKLPVRGDRFHVAACLIEPKSDHRGLRGSRDIARQIATKLAEMEQEHLDGRQ